MNRLVIVLLILFESISLRGQTDSMSFKLSEVIYNSTTKIECFKSEIRNGKKTNIKSVGTGFFFQITIEKDTMLTLVTNKHVVEGSLEGFFKFNTFENGKPKYGDTVTIKVTNFEKLWIAHPSEDLAIIPIMPFVNSMITRTNKLPAIIPIPEYSIPSETIEDKFEAIEEVIMVGYPKGFSDSINNVAIIRKGITATPYFLNYNNTPRFLVDIPIFSGSSGSPIFIYSNGKLGNMEVFMQVAPKIYFIGIASDSRNYDAIGIGRLEGSNKNIITRTSLPLNIAYAIKSKVILDFKKILKTKFTNEYNRIYSSSFR